jgi:predicted branched-subunit amino acid permease
MSIISIGSWRDGLRDSAGFGAAFIPLYLAIGIAGQQSTHTFAETMGMTLFLFSTPLQFALTQNHGGFFVIAPLVLMMNARFILLSANLAPFLGKTSFYKLIPSSILMCPSVFSGCMARFRKPIEQPFRYFLGLGLPIWSISIVCTAIGFLLAGNAVSPFWILMLKLVLPFQFTMLAAKHWGEHFSVASYVLGFIVAPILFGVLRELSPLLTPLVVGFSMVMLEDILNPVELDKN